MSKQLNLIKDAINYYRRGDFSLGYRTLLDTALNTNDYNVFREVLQFVECYERTVDEDKLTLLNSFENCTELIRKASHQKEDTSGQLVLEGNNLTKDYNKGRFVLGPINIQLRKGDIYGLVGENGNGKTTLLTVLAQQNKITNGKLHYYFGIDKNRYDLRSKLVYIPQRTGVWYGSVLDNLKFALIHHGVKGENNELLVLMMVARFGLWNYKDLKWKELSSGYKMRFELARTFLRRPEVILLDEPLANLDILAQQVILEDLKMLSKSPVYPIAMIFSSQQLYEVEKISDHVVYLRNGKPSEQLNLEKKVSGLVVELDIDGTRDEIETLFSKDGLQKLEFNGGVYILYFGDSLGFKQLLARLSKSEMKVQYIRDISESTRRFFVY